MEYTPEEQAENRRKWVEALRSGDYQQGRRSLRPTNDTYCCLGVACDVLSNENQGWEANQGEFWFYRSDGSLVARELPSEVRDMLGLQTAVGNMTKLDWRLGKSLASMNDEGSTFEEIADIIESEPPYLLRNPDGSLNCKETAE